MDKRYSNLLKVVMEDDVSTPSVSPDAISAAKNSLRGQLNARASLSGQLNTLVNRNNAPTPPPTAPTATQVNLATQELKSKLSNLHSKPAQPQTSPAQMRANAAAQRQKADKLSQDVAFNRRADALSRQHTAMGIKLGMKPNNAPAPAPKPPQSGMNHVPPQHNTPPLPKGGMNHVPPQHNTPAQKPGTPPVPQAAPKYTPPTPPTPKAAPQYNAPKPKLSSFGKAFAQARQSGAKIFTWNNKKYTTQMK